MKEAAIDIVIESRPREIVEGFRVRRVLPSVKRRMIGPFVFFDAMGPEILAPGRSLDVAPHPHIGLSTLTYLFAGEMVHRDGLGTVQTIRPGEVNWMTAGRGLAHSERSPPGEREASSELFGIQSWVALPQKFEESPPAFSHHSSEELPVIEGEGANVCLIAGSLFGERSPVHTFSELFYADVTLAPGAGLAIPTSFEERAVYIVKGEIDVASDGTFPPHQLLVLKPNEEVVVRGMPGGARFILLGGEPLDGKRFIWWNFVSSSGELIEQAKSDWKVGNFKSIPGETEYIPLPPDSRPAPVRYP